MPTTDDLTYDQTPPRLPVLDDLHGGLLQNVAGSPPGPDHPNALALNQGDKLVVAHANVICAVAIEVRFTGGVPLIVGVYGTRTGLVAADFGVTDNGGGDTSITHTGGKLPPVRWSAYAQQVDDVEIDRGPRVSSITNGWRVKTKLAAVGTDSNFVLFVSGL